MKQRFENILHFSILGFLLIALILYVAKSATDLDIKNIQKQKANLEKIEMQERVLYYQTLNAVQKDKERMYYEALKEIQNHINEEWYKWRKRPAKTVFCLLKKQTRAEITSTQKP